MSSTNKADVHDVVGALLAATGPMTAMKLQKLAYYVQAWHLARFARSRSRSPSKRGRTGR